MMASGYNFVDGLVNGESYRQQQEAVEASQSEFLDESGLGKIPYMENLTTMSHAAGDAGAYVHDVFGWLTD
jgi:hypothetical protein